jgi:hypothetical protein
MIRKIILLTALATFPIIGGATKAQAADNEYCREYTKTVRIGGRTEQAYGTACYRPDGSWEIVDLEGSAYGREQVREVIYDDVRHDYRRNPVREVVVVERHGRPYYPYYRRASYNNWPFALSFNFGDHDDHHHYKKKVKYKYKDHHRHHDHGRRGHR